MGIGPRSILGEVLLVGQGGKTPYETILVNTYGASEVWPLVDIASGTTIKAKGHVARNGTLSGWDLQNAAGPYPNVKAPYSDGANDYGSVLSASHQSIFNGAIGSIFGWFYKDTWPLVVEYIFDFEVSSSNYIRLYTNSTANLRFQYKAGGTTKTLALGTGFLGWNSFGISWKDASNGDEVIAYLNGVQVGTTQSSNGTWSGTPTIMSLSALAGDAATFPFKGWMAYLAVKYGSIWTPTQFAAMDGAAFPNP